LERRGKRVGKWEGAVIKTDVGEGLNKNSKELLKNW
jgi:hypothetical protein